MGNREAGRASEAQQAKKIRNRKLATVSQGSPTGEQREREDGKASTKTKAQREPQQNGSKERRAVQPKAKGEEPRAGGAAAPSGTQKPGAKRHGSTKGDPGTSAGGVRPELAKYN